MAPRDPDGGPLPSRRDVLRTLVAASGMPALVSAATQRPTVGIIGGGMAGVSLAWLLDGARDVVLLEARATDRRQHPRRRGRSRRPRLRRRPGRAVLSSWAVSCIYRAPVVSRFVCRARRGTHSFPASITVADPAEATPRFVSPIFWERTWPLQAPWNLAGVAAFGLGFQAAKVRELANASWWLTLEDWLPTLGLTQQQWEGMLLPWAASIFSGSIETRADYRRGPL